MAGDQEKHVDEIFGDSDSDDEDFYGFDLDSDEEGEGNDEDDSGDEADLPEEQRQDAAFQAYRHNWLIDFSENVGVRFPFDDNPMERDIFLSVFNDEVFELLVRETNRYAEQEIEKLRRNERLRPHSRASLWKEVSMPEMKAFIGLVLLMGYVKLPTYAAYWSTNFLVQLSGLRKIMARDRFLSILQFFHLCNNCENLPSDHSDHDQLFKLHQFMNMIVELWQGAYYPERDLAIDETFIACKGRIHLKQYKPRKPHKWGLNAWTLAESKTGYVFNWDIYAGKTAANDPRGMTFGVVADIARPVYARGHHIYMDNYFSSPALFDELARNGIGACGTLRLNRNGIPEEAANAKPAKGDSVFTRDGRTLYISWTDKRQVNLISTIHTSRTFQRKVRSKNREGGGEDQHHQFIEKPCAIELYTRNMGGVDRSDQKASYHVNAHKTTKWWKKGFFHMLEVSFVNATIIFQHLHPELRKFDVNKFRLNVMEQLVQMDGAQRPGRHIAEADHPRRLLERHFPAKNKAKMPAGKQAMPDCVVCSNRTAKVIRQKKTTIEQTDKKQDPTIIGKCTENCAIT